MMKMITVGIDTLNEAKADLDDSFIMEKDVEALRRVIDELPSGYKIIFNLLDSCLIEHYLNVLVNM